MKSDKPNKKTRKPIHEISCRYLFLVQNRMYWRSCPITFDKDRDFVLTYDFGVFKEIGDIGGRVAFLDHLVEPDVMEKYNYETYDFFANWHYDRNGNDIFSYRGTKVGNALRISIWSNITQYARTLINLLAIKKINHEKIFAGIDDGYTNDILNALDIKMEVWKAQSDGSVQEYYFPILRWIDERIYPSGKKQAIKMILTKMLDLLIALYDCFKLFGKKDTNIFIHPYHPTQKIIEALKRKPSINLIFENFTWTEGFFKERRLPVHGRSNRYKQLSLEMINSFQSQKNAKWSIQGFPVSEYIYPIIIKRISETLADCLKTVDCIFKYFEKRKLDLMVTISNIGFINCLMLNYCHHHHIPTYLIINGLLTNSYLDEAKEATWINAYGESVKNNYFRAMDNIVCLGDPRMDNYVNSIKPKQINTDRPTIAIGASGFNNIDLNSYVAAEFDFLYDVMSASKTLKARGLEFDLVLKTRPNGYIQQYSAFLEEYYPEMKIRIYDRIPMKDILSQADLYISIYSQTLFEASCMGIPVIYYKKDTQMMHPPFDGKSELVTAVSLDDLVQKIDLFYERHPMYEAFKEKKIMEKYIGPLDGNNTDRNLNFIYTLLHQN